MIKSNINENNEVPKFTELKEFQEFITENNIISPNDFKKRFYRVYSRMQRLGFIKYIKYTDEYERNKEEKLFIAQLNDVFSIQKFIDDNNIKSKKELRENYSKVYSKFCKELSEEERSSIIFQEQGRHYYSDEELMVDNINEYLNKNNIKSPAQLRKENPQLYDVIYRRLAKEDLPKLDFPNKIRSYTEYNDFESIQRFIEDNNVINKKDLHNRFPGLYIKYNELKNFWERDISFIKSNLTSIGEKYIAVELIKRGVYFITQKTYPDLKNKESLRFDFYLPKYNILIEHQGEGHFGKGKYYTEDVINSDILKHDYAEKNNIKLYYYTIYKSDYNKFGYMYDVITEIQDLIDNIDSNLKILKNSEQLVKDYFSKDISYFNNLIKDLKIENKEELYIKEQSIYNEYSQNNIK